MAIVKSVWLRGTKKRLAGTVLYQSQGRTLQRELATEVSNPRTEAQMTQRIKWSNLVNFYRANANWMRKAFETKKTYQSDYNKFMSLNVSNSIVALTKTEAAQGACVVAPYQMTEGSLPAIEINKSGAVWASNLYVDSAFVLNADTTVGALSASLLANNAGIERGDQLSFIRVTQNSSQATGIPFVIVRPYEMLIDASSTELVSKYLPLELLSVGSPADVPCILVQDNGGAGGFTWVLSRTTSGKTRVSTSYLTQVDNAAIYSKYTSDEHRVEAIESYGEGKDVFLDTNAAGAIPGFKEPISILSLNVGSQIYLSSSEAPTGHQLYEDSPYVLFNTDVPSNVTAVTLLLFGSADGSPTEYNCTGIERAGNKVSFSAAGMGSELWSQKVRIISVVTPNGTFDFEMRHDGHLDL